MKGTAIVTGASRGLGLEFARRLAKSGYSVGILARNKEQLEKAAKETDAIYEVGDATDPATVKRLVERCEKEKGPVSLFVANAGVWGPIGRVWSIDPEVWWKDFSTNIKSAMVATSVIAPHMIKRDLGKIVLISAQAGAFRWPLCSAYSSSKAAINKLAENVAWELPKPTKVRIFSYHPGFLELGISNHAKSLLNSPDPDVQATAKSVLLGFEKKKTNSPEKSFEGLMQIVSGKFDGRNGSFITLDEALKQS